MVIRCFFFNRSISNAECDSSSINIVGKGVTFLKINVWHLNCKIFILFDSLVCSLIRSLQGFFFLNYRSLFCLTVNLRC